MVSLSSSRAKVVQLPLEVTTELIRQLYRNEIIELVDIGCLARLEDVTATNSSLSIFKIGLLGNDLAERLMIKEAIIKLACRVSVHHIDLIRFSLLNHIRRLQIDVDYLDFEYPLGVLSNLPAIEEVTVIVKCPNWRERIAITSWICWIEIKAADASIEQVTMRELTHSEWRYDLILQATFWEGFGSGDVHVSHATHEKFGIACKVCISKGKIIELDTAEDTRGEWREALIEGLKLEPDREEREGDKNQDEGDV